VLLESPEQGAVTATAADDIWTPEQMGKFLDLVAAHRLAGCFALTLLGLRREEVGGLRWSDIDRETDALRIRQARVHVNERDTLVATKTQRSARDLPLPPREVATLTAMRSAHLRERLAVGRPLADADLLLSRTDGTWLPVREYAREFRRAAQCGRTQGDPVGQAPALQHLADARGRCSCRCRRRLARSHRAHDARHETRSAARSERVPRK
jgi:integrase